MVYKLVYSKQAEKDLARLDNAIAVKILKNLDLLIKLMNPFVKAKKLTGFGIPTYRFRVGDYRVVFRKDERTGRLVILVVLRIAHRKEVYKKF